MTIELRSARFLLAFASACTVVGCGDDGGTLGWGGQPGLAGSSSSSGGTKSGGGTNQGRGGASGGAFSFTGGVNGIGTGGALVGSGGTAGQSPAGGTQAQTGGVTSMSGSSGQSATGGALTNQGGATSGGSNGKGGSASGGSTGKGGSSSGGSTGKGGSASGGASTLGGSATTGGSPSAGSAGMSATAGAGGSGGAGSGVDLCPYPTVGTDDPWCFVDATDFGHWNYMDTSSGFSPASQWIQAGSDGYARLVLPFTAANQETQFAVALSSTTPLDLSGRVIKARVRRTAGSGPGTLQLFATSLGWNRATSSSNALSGIPGSSWTVLSFVLDPAAVVGGFDPNAIVRLGLYVQSSADTNGLTTNEIEVDSVWIE